MMNSNRDNSYHSLEEEGLSFSCRFCLEEGNRKDFIAPCNCSGTSRWVHRHCLDTWRSTREDKAFSRCTECKAPYELICLTADEDSTSATCYRRCRFCAYFSRDILLVIILCQLGIIGLGWLFYLIDSSNGCFFLSLIGTKNYLSFYYLCGLFLLLSLFGMVAVCARNGLLECLDGCIFYPDSCYFYPNPFYLAGSPQGGDCCCYCCGPHCCEACGMTGGAVPSCECGSCCAGAAIGEEIAILVFVALIIFAAIGVFFCVVIGSFVVQQIVRRHIHILNKWNLTKEFIVKDLAPGGLSAEEVIQQRKKSSQDMDVALNTVDDSSNPSITGSNRNETWRGNEMGIALVNVSAGSSSNSAGNYFRISDDLCENDAAASGDLEEGSPFVRSYMDRSTSNMPMDSFDYGNLSMQQRALLQRHNLL